MRNTRRSNMAPSQTRPATESVDLPQCGVARVVRHAEQGIMGTPRSRGLFYSLHFWKDRLVSVKAFWELQHWTTSLDRVWLSRPRARWRYWERFWWIWKMQMRFWATGPSHFI